LVDGTVSYTTGHFSDDSDAAVRELR